MKKLAPWGEATKEKKPKQTCQVARPTWYDKHTMFKPAKDWADEELAEEHKAVRARILGQRV